MNERERLIELLKKNVILKMFFGTSQYEKLANYLLKNNVLAPPFKIGQKVWYISTPRRKENIFSAKVLFITYTELGYILSLRINGNLRFEMDEDDVYATKEEAETALKGE